MRSILRETSLALFRKVHCRDNIGVGRHKTARLSASEPIFFFFFVNFAIGGVSGWKRDLSRYGGMAGMDVDCVRVNEGR